MTDSATLTPGSVPVAARDAVVDLKGAGDIHVKASNLEANIFGAGAIRYHGSPRVNKYLRGVGSVKPAKETQPAVAT